MPITRRDLLEVSCDFVGCTATAIGTLIELEDLGWYIAPDELGFEGKVEMSDAKVLDRAHYNQAFGEEPPAIRNPRGSP